MPLYEVQVITDFSKTLLIEAPDARTAGRVIYDDPRAVFVKVLEEGIGYEKVIGHVRRSRGDVRRAGGVPQSGD